MQRMNSLLKPLDLISMAKFLDQSELFLIYKQYVSAYESTHPDVITSWRVYDTKVLRALDGASVFFQFDNPIFGERKSDREAIGSISNSLTERILNLAALFLLSKMPIEEVPDQMRICLAVCHGNLHWTGVTANLNGFQQFYRELLQYCEENQLNIAYGNTRDIVLGMLGLNRNFTMDQLRESLQVRFIGQVSLEHYDSMNNQHYFDRTNDSLRKFNETFASTLNVNVCSQQRGNTCGDHTVINLFMSSLMGIIPNIHQKEMTSAELRKLTSIASKKDYSEEEKNKQAAVTLQIAGVRAQAQPIRNLSSPSFTSSDDQEMEEKDEIENQANILHCLQIIIETNIRRLFQLDPKNATMLINDANNGIEVALGSYSKKHKLRTFFSNTNKEELTILKLLASLLTGNENELTKPIYNKLQITTEEDRVTYGRTASLFAKDAFGEIEEDRLFNAMSIKELEEQQRILDEIQAKKESSDNKNTPQQLKK